MTNSFSEKYPNLETHTVDLKPKHLNMFLRELVTLHATARRSGFNVPLLTFHEAMPEYTTPHVTYEQIEGAEPLDSQRESLSRETRQSVMRRARDMASDFKKAFGYTIYNINGQNVYYKAREDSVWLYDLRQIVPSAMSYAYFRIKPKVDDPKVEDPMGDDPKVNDPEVEDPKVEEPTGDDLGGNEEDA